MSFTVQIVRPTEVITIVIFGFMNKNWLDLTCRHVGDASFHVLYRYLAAAHLTCFQPPRSWCCRGAARRPPPWTGPASPCRPGRSSSWPRTSCWSRPGRPAAGPSEGPLSSAERRDRAPTVRPLLALQPYQPLHFHFPFHPFHPDPFILAFWLHFTLSFVSSPSTSWPPLIAPSKQFCLSTGPLLCALPVLQQPGQWKAFVVLLKAKVWLCRTKN